MVSLTVSLGLESGQFKTVPHDINQVLGIIEEVLKIAHPRLYCTSQAAVLL